MSIWKSFVGSSGKYLFLFLLTLIPINLPAQTDAYGKPAGFIRFEIPSTSQRLSSIPFIPFDNSLNAIFNGQLTGENNDDAADKLVKWIVGSQQYESAFKAGNTGDSAKDGKWFDNDTSWTPTTLTLSPGEGFWIQNQHSSQQSVFLMGKLILDDTKSILLYQNMNLFSFPFTSKIDLNSTTLKNDGAHGAATQNASPGPDVISKVNPDTSWWLLDDENSPNNGKWLDVNNILANEYLKTGLSYWYNRQIATSFTWTENRPYQNPFNVSASAPAITGMSINSSLNEITLNISCTGAAGETLEILFKDVTADDSLVTESGWSVAATGIATNSATTITWTDAGEASPSYPLTARTAVTSPHMRLYLVIRADRDTDGDSLPDGREIFCTGTNSANSDSDADGFSDSFELQNGLNPLSSDSDGDFDSDGLTNGSEFANGYNPIVYTRVLYVDNNRSDDTGDGLTPATAKKTISAAVNAISNDGNEHVILVTAGTYTGSSNKNIEFGGKQIKLRSISGAATTIIDCENSGRAFYLHAGEDSNSWIDGFTVKNGNSVYGSSASLWGVSSIIKNCRFENNSSNSAIFAYYSPFTLQNCVFSGNNGGYGTCLYFNGSTHTIKDCTFENNSTPQDGSACYLYSSTDSFENCKFKNNTANFYGTIYTESNASQTFTKCEFSGNSNQNGGVFFIGDTDLILRNCLLINNTATYTGGVIRNQGGNKTITIENTTMAFNNAPSGDGIWAGSTAPTINIKNSIVWDSISATSATKNVNYSCTLDDYTGTGTGNIKVDPKLTPSGWLTSTSPCIDAGTTDGAPADDINGLARPAGSGIDMGCDEYRDSDADGMPDWLEVSGNLEATDDTDGDGLYNLQEFTLGTNPLKADTDGDGLDDNAEYEAGYNPVLYTKVIYVDASQADDSGSGLTLATAKKTISAAVNAMSKDGNEHLILVAAGTYTGSSNKNIEFGGKQIKLRSISGAESTIIDCENSGKAFYIHNGERYDTWIDGFTIRNGNNTNGGAIAFAGDASITVKNCVFETNYASASGGAVWAYYCSPIFENCTFSENSACSYGGAVLSNGEAGDASTFRNCRFADNNSVSDGAALAVIGANHDVIENCVFYNNASTNFGGALLIWNSSTVDISKTRFISNMANIGGAVCTWNISNLSVSNSLMALNEAKDRCGTISAGNGTISLLNTTICGGIANGGTSSRGPGIYVSDSDTPVINIKNSIIWNYIYAGGATFNVNYSCTIDDYTASGTGNINTNPLLTPSGWLTATSPCIDAGTSDGAPADDINSLERPVGNGIDMGCDEYSDSDEDGIPDWLDNFNEEGSLFEDGDFDEDGLTNILEFIIGTDPYEADSDYDGISDGDEYEEGYDPLNYTKVIYVDASQSDDSGSGLTLATAKKTISAAVNAMSKDGNEHVILVAAGTYTGSSNKNIEFGGKQIKLCSISGAESTIIDCENSGKAFYIHNGERYDTWIDGFTIRNGNNTNGGAISFAGDASITVKNCVFEMNYASASGGAVWAYYCSPIFENCTFTENSACSYGGTIASNGEAGDGSTFRNCSFENNSSVAYGAAIAIYGANHDVIENCVFYNNASTNFGGTLYIWNGATVDISKSKFISSFGNIGGAISTCNINSLNISNCLFSANEAKDRGGAINSGTGAITLLNTTICGSKASSGRGPGIYVTTTDTPSINIKNSIIWNNIVQGGATFNVNYSCMLDDYTAIGTGNINTNPLLTPSGWLTATSPCIDAGTSDGAPSDDINSLERPAASGIDMGCDEYRDSDADNIPDWFESEYGENGLDGTGDLDGDGLTNLQEFTIGTDPSLADTDFDGINDAYEYEQGYNPLCYTKVIYVDNAQADDSGNGLTPETAKKTISAAVTAITNDGNEHVILVAAGTYTGTSNKNIEFGGKQIKLRSISGAESTIIDCENSGRAFYLHAGEDSNSWIDGFTVKNGNSVYGSSASLWGVSSIIKNCRFENNSSNSAIFAYYSPFTLQNCVFSGNNGGYGTCLYFNGSTHTIKDCTFENNSTTQDGSACYLYSSTDSFENCKFKNNTSNFYGTIYTESNASQTFTKCEFSGNSNQNGGVFFNDNSDLVLKNCLLINNTATYTGGVIRNQGGNKTITIENTTMAFNNAPSGDGIWAGSTAPTINIKNSIVWDSISAASATKNVNYSCTFDDYTGTGTGNINTDPLLTATGYLTSTSPCIDAGTTDGAQSTDIQNENRPAGSGIDMGCDEYRDTDNDGIPDLVETAMRMDPANANDATGDNDGDGINNLNEYLAGTLTPVPLDNDHDGLSDDLEAQYGTDPNNADSDNDGLSDYEEINTYNTDPNSADTDNDGLSDYDEAKSSEYATIAENIDPSQMTSVVQINGADFSNSTGTWAKEGTEAVCSGRRGYIEYTVDVNELDVYKLIFSVREYRPLNSALTLKLWIDGEYIGKQSVTSVNSANVDAGFFTPALTSGTHTVKLLFDNPYPSVSLVVSTVTLYQISGADNDKNNLKDWLQARLYNLYSFDNITESRTSPVFIEGKAKFLNGLSINSGEVQAYRSTGERWFANMPLLTTTEKSIQVSFEKGLKSQTKNIAWKTTNIIKENNLALTIRKGDSLLLECWTDAASSGTSGSITVGSSTLSCSPGNPVAYTFNTAGTFTVSGICSRPGESDISGSITVKVVEYAFGLSAQTFWTGKQRNMDINKVSTDISIVSDPRLSYFAEAAQQPDPNKTRVEAIIDNNEDRVVTARVGANGPILCTLNMNGATLWNGTETDVAVVETLEDGSKIMEMPLICSPVPSNITVTLTLFAEGVIFEGGGTTKNISSADFDSLGSYTVRFISPPNTDVSICHTTYMYQSGIYVGDK